MIVFAVAAALLLGAQSSQNEQAGSLRIIGKEGRADAICPLKHTEVVADIAGIATRVTVKQSFTNPSTQAIEAVYTFPLPADAAVDHMALHVGDRTITAKIKKRQEAREVYEQAKSRGQIAGLLDQERPNIFTQSVANIMPGANVDVEISYMELLPYKHGQYEFVYPMVVGPRYLANAPDREKINPPFVKMGSRAGTDIGITVNLDAGAEIQELESVLHPIKSRRLGVGRARITLVNANQIPNKDFILHYSLAQKGIQEAFVTHTDPRRGGFFSLVLNPPKEPDTKMIASKEVVFVIDQSGSQTGFPIEKSKQLTLKLIHTLNPDDTFTVLGFSNAVNYLWETPRAASEANLAQAETFIIALSASGGTELFRAVQASLDIPRDPRRLRIVAFNTDGYVGDEERILGSISARNHDARMFTFGIGNSVNRFLIDAMSSCGRGDSEVVTLESDADKALARFVERTESPILTNIEVRFDGVPVSDVSPKLLPDIFGGSPLVIAGRYAGSGRGQVEITALLGGLPWHRTINLDFPASNAKDDCVATLWARKRISDLNTEKYRAAFRHENPNATIEQITNLGLNFGLMTEYTSFVAVEERVVNMDGKPVTVAVPVDLPEGVTEAAVDKSYSRVSLGMPPGSPAPMISGGSGFGRGSGGRAGGGFGNVSSLSAGVPASASAKGDLKTYDPNSAVVLQDDTQSQSGLRTFLTSPSEPMAAALRRSDQAMLRKLVAKLTKAEQLDFWYVLKVAPSLRTSKRATELVRLNVKAGDAAELAKLLKGKAFDHPSLQGVKTLYVSATKKQLRELAQRAEVLQILAAN